MIRALLLSLCLVLSGLAAVVAETRMAAAGGYCGTGTPAILLDAAGLPLLDADGAPIDAPDCPACTLILALVVPGPALWPTEIHLRTAAPIAPVALLPLTVFQGHQARAPPSLV